ncbi:MAG: DNA repair protein RadC [Chloroflexi bacterium]|nr:DNA repair protein RadC [Chloroflexota bacterium]
MGVKDLPPDQRPRERLKARGARDLPDAELLAIILREGSSKYNAVDTGILLLNGHGGLPGIDSATLDDLRVFGVGEVKAIQIKAALELGKRVATMHPGHRAQVKSPLDIFNLVQGDMSTLEQEHLRVLLMDTKNRVITSKNLYVGTLNSTTVRVGELFREAIRANAAAIALVHNHPSGDPTPSPQDVELTRDAAKAGQLLDVDVLDHVVVGRGPNNYVSLRERGLGFPPRGSG